MTATQTAGEPALRVRDLGVHYGGVVAAEGIGLEVGVGECVAIVGANGAGKTSILRGIAGFESVGRSSTVELNGVDVTRMRAEVRARRGLGHVLEGRHVFPGLTVLANLEVAARATRCGAAELRRRVDAAFDIFPELTPLRTRPAGALSGGQQQFLALARSLAMQPKVVLMDEPTVGVAPVLVVRIGEAIRHLLSTGISVLLVEQALELVQSAASTVHFLVHGTIAETMQAQAEDLVQTARALYLR